VTFHATPAATRVKAGDENLTTLVVVHFREARKYIHADQYWFNFKTGRHWHVRSNSATYSEGIKKYTWPHLEDEQYDVDSATWASYLRGQHEYGEAIVPFFNIGLSKNLFLEKEAVSEADKYLFLNQVQVCPLCGSSGATETGEDHRFAPLEEWELYWNSSDNEMAEVARRWKQNRSDEGWAYLKKLIDSGGLKSRFISHARCKRCRDNKWSFRDAWKYRHEKVIRPNWRSCHNEDWDAYRAAKKMIESIWPEDFQTKQSHRKAIFKHARKRASIKPLSRGELAFFSMHLAASQVKELKATNRTHDTNKILNQAN
jgi:hypothetical protein